MAATVLADIDNQPYNLKIGPVTLRADAGSTVSYNDNINLAESGRQADWIITPAINVHGLWQASELNVLTFDLGVGYEQYLIHPNASSILLSPDSQVEFKIFVGDFKITLSNSFSLQDNPEQVGQLSNVTQFQRFTNDAGVTVDWDVGDITAKLGYDHTSFWVFEQAYNYLDYQSDTVSPQVAFNLSKTMHLGINSSLTSTRYDQNIQNNSIRLLAGPFIKAQISENISTFCQAGWEYSDYAHGGSNGDTSNIDSYYGSVGITHRINDDLRQSLTFGREFLPGITSNNTDRIYVNYTPSWHATYLFDLAPQLWWESLKDSDAPVRETSTRFGAGVTVGFTLTQHSIVNLSYNYVKKSSNLSSMSYDQDLITLGLNYQF